MFGREGWPYEGLLSRAKGSDRVDFVFSHGRKERFAQLLELCPQVIHQEDLEGNRDFLREVEVVLCTWNMLPLTEAQLEEYFPSLRLVLYAAGSVQYFCQALFKAGNPPVQRLGQHVLSCGAVYHELHYLCQLKGAFRLRRWPNRGVT